MKTLRFYEAGTEAHLGEIELDDAPVAGDTFVLPDGLPWRVVHRTWRVTVDRAPRVTRVVIEVWIRQA